MMNQPKRQILVIMEPTWLNHYVIFRRAADFYHINMYDQQKNGFKFDEVAHHLKSLVPKGSIVLMQACANNPTGIDPTEKQWVEISKICKDRELIPLVDSAYLGFVTADFNKDSFLIKMLAEDGHNFLFCQSFSKNMGLYGERLGVLHVVCKDKEMAARTTDYFSEINAETIGTPGSFAARIASKVLGSQEYRNEWIKELQSVTQRMLGVRSSLLNKLKELKTPGTWEHIVNQRGLFTYIGLDSIIYNRILILIS